MRLQSSSTGGLAVGEADNRYLRLAGGTMTGELNALAGLNTVRPYSSGLVPAGLSDPAPAFPFETQWNNAGKNWTAIRVSVTNTASGSGSKLFELQVDSSNRFFVDKNGVPNVGNLYATNSIIKSITNGAGLEYVYTGDNTVALVGEAGIRALCARNGQYISVGSSTPIGWTYQTQPGATSIDTGLARSQAGVVEFNNGAPGTLRDWKARRGSLSEYLDITEMSAPAAPAANTARLYVEDNGSGKTRLMVLFPTGAAQVLATEP